VRPLSLQRQAAGADRSTPVHDAAETPKHAAEALVNAAETPEDAAETPEDAAGALVNAAETPEEPSGAASKPALLNERQPVER